MVRIAVHLDLSDIALVRRLALAIRRIYQHETCPKVLKTYIRFELAQVLGTKYDIEAFLKGHEE